jgi:hypothetical protein
MEGIPLHTGSPISPKTAIKADEYSPSTAAARYAPSNSTRQASQSPPAVPPPAASTIVRSPTFAARQQDSFAAPYHRPSLTSLHAAGTRDSPSPTSSISGAVPCASYTDARRASIPPPPKAGEIPKPAAYYAPQYDGNLQPISARGLSLNTSMPTLNTYQMQGTLLSPVRAQPRSAATSIATPISVTKDLSHPPGYMQDSRASFSERPPELVSPISHSQNSHSRGRSRNGNGIGILDGGGHDAMEDEDRGLWDTAVSWAKTVGEKVIEGEEEVWKRINRSR